MAQSTRSEKPVVQSFVVGSFSGVCSTVLFQPLDLIKTRLQSPHLKTKFKLKAVVIQVIREDRIFGLWKGLTPSLLRCVPGMGIYFASLSSLKNVFINVSKEETAVQSVILGTISRCFSVGSLLPLTVIKTRFESGHYRYGGVLEAIRKIYSAEGIRGLYCGLTATVIRDAPYSGLYLMFYTQSKRRLPKSTWDYFICQLSTFETTDWESEHSSIISSLCYFSCGVFSGILASVFTHPADVVKTHMQLFPAQFGRLKVALVHIYKVDGIKGYFRGLLPRLMRRTLVTAMTWTIYEQVMKSVGVK